MRSSEIYDRIVREAMEKFRWSRIKAENMAKKVVKRIEKRASTKKKPKRDPKAPLTKVQIANLPPLYPRKPAKTAKERMERKLGPDDGRRRGGSPTVQGGSTGLGKRR